MDKYTFWLEFSKFFIPATSAVFLFYLATLREDRVNNKDVLKERLNQFYSPFYILCTKHVVSDIPYSKMPDSIHREFLELLLNNLHFIDTSLHESIEALHVITIMDLAPRDDKQQPTDNQSQSLDYLFKEIIFSIYIQHTILCKKLKLIKPSKKVYGFEK